MLCVCVKGLCVCERVVCHKVMCEIVVCVCDKVVCVCVSVRKLCLNKLYGKELPVIELCVTKLRLKTYIWKTCARVCF